MGPRLDRRGNREGQHRMINTRAASMGPRLDRRGNDASFELASSGFELQWGHAWIGVGMDTSARSRWQRSRFNGATPG